MPPSQGRHRLRSGDPAEGMGQAEAASRHGSARAVSTAASAEIASRGALDVLRTGIKDSGIRFQLAYFRPASGRRALDMPRRTCGKRPGRATAFWISSASRARRSTSGPDSPRGVEPRNPEPRNLGTSEPRNPLAVSLATCAALPLPSHCWPQHPAARPRPRLRRPLRQRRLRRGRIWRRSSSIGRR